jgi:hypothetical protein
LGFVNKLLDCEMLQVLLLLPDVLSPSEPNHNQECLQLLDNLCEIYPTAVPEHLAERTPALEKLSGILASSTVDRDQVGCVCLHVFWGQFHVWIGQSGVFLGRISILTDHTMFIPSVLSEDDVQPRELPSL